MSDEALTAHEKPHPGTAVYIKIAITLFVLTALEVAAYEVARRGAPAGLAGVVQPIIVPILLVLSAAKFALVAMFYMHLKQDSKLFSSVFVFPILIAAILVFALVALFWYLGLQHP
ncbi:MAG: cytochrome C oxidase subunit IV [Gemmatimonadales bacterium]|nr:cytochrome C oxidase subunit IV [Gemmatimonadales bacterium]